MQLMNRFQCGRFVVAALMGLALIGCGGEQIDAPGGPLVPYSHPSDVFSLAMPAEWVVNDASDESVLRVEFSPPDVPDPQVVAYVVSTGKPPEQVAFDETVSDYLQRFYEEPGMPYREAGREVQPDGSLRLAMLVEAPNGTVQFNDFLVVDGPYFVVLRARLSDDPAQLGVLQRVVATFEVNPEAEWGADIEGVVDAGEGVIGFTSLNTWADQGGGFNVVGQVVNTGSAPLEFVRVTARLYDVGNELVREQSDFIAADVVGPGEASPFSIVFVDGLPSGVVRYELHATARHADFVAETFYGPDNFALADQADYDENGLLVISGQVRNEGSRTADLVKVIVTVFDDQQRVVGTDTTLVEAQSLAPGETSTFRVTFGELGGQPDTYISVVQATASP
jgi:hypothetical protein